jgi:putative heme-binding domain-containing protein
LVGKALQDSHPGVRENAIKLAEPRMRDAASLVQRLLSMERDPDGRVRFQLLCTLGFIDTAASRAARDRLLAADFDSRWMQIAALSASPEEANRLIPQAIQKSAPASFFRQAAAVIGARRRPAELESLLASVSQARAGEWRVAALEGLAAGLRGSEAPVAASVEIHLARLFNGPDAGVRRAALHLLQRAGVSGKGTILTAVRRAEQAVADQSADAEWRADAIGLLSLADPAAHRATFEQLIKPAEPEAVQAAAIRAIGEIPGGQTGRFLLKNWRGLTPKARIEAVDALYRDPDRIPMILAALQSGEIQPWTLSFRHRSRLVMHRDPKIREAARKLLQSVEGERAAVIARYQPALEITGDASRGKIVFRSVCAKCHQLDGDGSEVGPDLATVRHQTRQVLLNAILDPNESISQGFEAYVVEPFSGSAVDGVLGAQTAATITLNREEGKQDVIQRKDIKNMYVNNLSAMPADLEKQVSVEQMADLLEYIKSPAR